MTVSKQSEATTKAPSARRRKSTETVTDIRPAASALASDSKGKIAKLVGLLMQPGGASVAAMMDATGWQAHSVRGAISGAIKKKLGLKVTSERTGAGRVYRIASELAE